MGVEKATISVRLRPGKDDDLITWWNGEPDRAFLLRKWIREQIGVKTVRVTPPKCPDNIVVDIELQPPPKAPLTRTIIEGKQPEKTKPAHDLMSQFD